MARENSKARLVRNIPDEVWTKAKEIAEKRGMIFNRCVTEALVLWIEKNKKKEVRASL
ncbi:MAG: hypothetical protein J5556_03605 [Deltaproteobacteria bacterium]|nr:hypothetical protein [Deltaproteobacteria bacterium]